MRKNTRNNTNGKYMKARPGLSGSDAPRMKIGSKSKEPNINPIKEVMGKLRFYINNLKRAKERE